MDHFQCVSPDDLTNGEHGGLRLLPWHCFFQLVLSAQRVSSSKLTKELL